MITHRNIVTSLLLKPLKHHLADVISFGSSKYLYSQFVLSKNTNNFSPFAFSSLMLKTFLCFVTAAMLSLYQSTVNCSSRNAEGNFRTKWITVNVISQTWNLCSYLKVYRACPLKDEGDSRLIKTAYLLENYNENDD